MTNKRILVVDDQEDLRGVLLDLPTGSGYVVLEVADRQAAIAMAKAEHPDVILMDIQMPIEAEKSTPLAMGSLQHLMDRHERYVAAEPLLMPCGP
jgi:CheY-like chemotaxis protein